MRKWISTGKITPYAKTNSKWIKDLNVGAKIIECLGENRGEMVQDTGFSHDLLDMIPKV